MNAGEIFVWFLIALLAAACIRDIARNVRSGSCGGCTGCGTGCSGNCGSCRSAVKHAAALKQLRAEKQQKSIVS